MHTQNLSVSRTFARLGEDTSIRLALQRALQLRLYWNTALEELLWEATTFEGWLSATGRRFGGAPRKNCLRHFLSSLFPPKSMYINTITNILVPNKVQWCFKWGDPLVTDQDNDGLCCVTTTPPRLDLSGNIAGESHTCSTITRVKWISQVDFSS